VEKNVGGETTTAYYIYDGDQVICEYDDVGNLRKKFLYGVGIDEVVRMSHVGRTADISGPTGQPDGAVDIYDLRKMSESWLKNEGDTGFNADADLNYDEKINNTDSDILSANWLAEAQLSEVHFYYHYNGLGSVIALSDSAGRTVEMYEYDVYGSTIIRAPTQEPPDTSLYGNPYMFTGRRFDTETGLYYYRARYYSTGIGRFLQVDPIGYEDSMNLYIYVGNNPITFVDPWGLCRDSTSWKLDSAIATGLVWADALGVYGKFGRMDTFDMKYMDTLINPYPNYGKPGAIADERFWDEIHENVGLGFGLAGVDRTSAGTLIEVWEMTEPGILSVWGRGWWMEYQGRSLYKGGVFENGQVGTQRDIEHGMRGYEAGRFIRENPGAFAREYFRD